MKKTNVTEVVLKLLMIIAIAEFIIMQLLILLPINLGVQQEALLDTFLLTAACTPFIYYFVIKPFVEDRDKAILDIRVSSMTDTVSGLPNRRLSMDYLEEIISASYHYKYFAGLLVLDVDDFQSVNEKFGHSAGDALLKKIGKRLIETLSPNDKVGRLTSDEFIILIENLDEDANEASKNLKLSAIKLLSSLREDFDYHGVGIKLDASIGMRLLGQKLITADSVLAQAKEALQESKVAGKGQAKYFEI